MRSAFTTERHRGRSLQRGAVIPQRPFPTAMCGFPQRPFPTAMCGFPQRPFPTAMCGFPQRPFPTARCGYPTEAVPYSDVRFPTEAVPYSDVRFPTEAVPYSVVRVSHGDVTYATVRSKICRECPPWHSVSPDAKFRFTRRKFPIRATRKYWSMAPKLQRVFLSPLGAQASNHLSGLPHFRFADLGQFFFQLLAIIRSAVGLQGAPCLVAAADTFI